MLLISPQILLECTAAVSIFSSVGSITYRIGFWDRFYSIGAFEGGGWFYLL